MKELLYLYWCFFKIGSVTFGGGYAMLPILQRDLCDKRAWLTYDDITDYYALGQSLPGIIAVNTAVFVGYNRRRILGGIYAALGMVTPSLIIITVIAAFIQRFAEYEVVVNALNGINVAVCALIINAMIKMIKTGIVDILTVAICIAAFFATVMGGISPILIVAVSAMLGVLLKSFFEKRKKKEKA